MKKKYILIIIALILVGGLATILSITSGSDINKVSKLNEVNLTGYIPNKADVPKQKTELDSKITLPDGFSIDYFAQNIKGARSLATNNKGLIFVGTRGEGKVYVIEDLNNDNFADNTITIASGLNSPNGVAYYNGNLYVAEINRIIKFEDIDNTYKDNPTFSIVNDTDYPSDTHHGWKYLAIGPDNKLYVPIGAPCNICNAQSPYSSITTINLDGSGFKVIATGIRNTVGFTWDSQGDLWFSDNGRDWFGDDLPPDELNVLTKAGQNFGYPFCHGGQYLDDEFGTQGDCEKYVKPVQNLGPHVAALGIKFAPQNYPDKFKNKLFIAEHGSWNRKVPIGYRISMVDANQGENTATNYQTFASGWLQNDGSSWGRPVDILFLQDGTMLVSDDKANAVYRINYVGN